jgi:hypothetical protein
MDSWPGHDDLRRARQAKLPRRGELAKYVNAVKPDMVQRE